jgi:hypothetical protein
MKFIQYLVDIIELNLYFKFADIHTEFENTVSPPTYSPAAVAVEAASYLCVSGS